MRLLSLLLVLLAAACTTSTTDPQTIVDRALEAHGSAVLDDAVVEFDFRGRHFVVTRNDGLFRYERIYTDAGRTIREVLDNDGLFREIDGNRVPMLEQEHRSVETAVNSVVYFALLPYFLNDPAVQKTYLGAATLQGEPYHKIEVTFRQEDGGRDWEDRFVYWIHQERYTMDYLAYFFHVNNGGTRFREAFNVRTVGGVRFADYKNYTAPSVGQAVERYDQMPADLQILSEVVLENVQVRR